MIPTDVEASDGMDPAAISFELVGATAEAARTVMAWRNDPETLRASFHREPKRWETFEGEFRREYFRDPGLPPLFALAGGARVAFVRLVPAPHPEGARLRRVAAVSINVAPEHRGRGLGTAVLRALAPVARGFGLDDIVAEVRAENETSLRTFEKAGYRRVGPAEKHVEDTGERCPIVRFVQPLTRAGTFGHDRVLVIAEAGSNWRMGTPARDRRMSEALIDAAAEAGADAVKFQTYRPETVYVENAGESDYLAAAGIKEDIRAIFADLAMPPDLIPHLAEHCRRRGIEFMSSPFSVADFEAVDPHVRMHKCASYEISHLRLLERFARSGKPLVLSTGAADEDDIAWAIETFRANGGGDLCLLQCTARYPAPRDSLNLAVIPWLKRRFGVPVGLSDHSRDPVEAPLAAVALGARAIEKHFTLDNRLPGPDHAFAITGGELKALVAAVRAAEQIVGTGVKEVLPAERELRLFARRGLQATRPIARGELLREGGNVEILRPGKQRQGLHPKHLPRLEGKPAARDIAPGDGIQEGDWIGG
jgi:sialic acid synthase SpsE/RimJ/RimL family protein N-acetyltransferase